MAHEIEYTDGRAQVLGRELWWHKLNVPLERNATWDDVLTHTPVLALDVFKVPMADLLDPNEPFTVQSDEYAVMRSDGQILRCGVGERYTEVQAQAFYDWTSEVRDVFAGHGEDAQLVSAGSIRNGRQYFFVFEQAAIEVNGVTFQGYLNALGSHDGSMSNSLRPSNVITVCANTYQMNLGKAAAFTFRHTANVEDRMAQALVMLKATQEAKGSFESTLRTLTCTRLETRRFDLLLDSLFPTQDVAARTLADHERAREAVRSLYVAPLNNGVERSGWSFVQAVNSYEQWNRPIQRVKGLGESTTRAVRQFDALAKGSQPLTDRAVELVLAGV